MRLTILLLNNQMLSTTPADKTAFVKQKLPTEIIGIICGFLDFETHTAMRSTCSSVRLYVPLRKVVGFVEYKNLIEIYKFESWPYREDIEETEKRKVFQERIHLDLHHEVLTQNHVQFLQKYELDYELSRIAQKVLDHPESYKGIDLLFEECYFLAAAASVGDLELLIRLLQVPLMDPAAGYNCAIWAAAQFGRLEIVQFLLQDLRVDPSDEGNEAIRCASQYGHLSVVQALLLDARVDPSDRDNYAIRWASQNGHLSVVQALMKDSRVDPSDRNNYAIRNASRNGINAVVQELLKDPRVDPSDDHNYAIREASENGHYAVVQELLKDPRVDPSDRDNYAIRWASQNGYLSVVQELLRDPRVDPSDCENAAIRLASRKGHTYIGGAGFIARPKSPFE